MALSSPTRLRNRDPRGTGCQTRFCLLLPKVGHESAPRTDAAVDEYGLRGGHHSRGIGTETLRHHLGFPMEEIEARENACSAATELGDALFPWLPGETGCLCLGVHTASGVTSVRRVRSMARPFFEISEYRFSRDMRRFETCERTTCTNRIISIVQAVHYTILDVFQGARRRYGRVCMHYLRLYRRMLQQLMRGFLD